MSSEIAHLVLADGTVYRGIAFGAPARAADGVPPGSGPGAPPGVGESPGVGEVVFHTGLSGYQEILTDPSYAGQIVCMTCPEIGNVGVNPEDEESSGLYLRGFVVRHHVDFPSSWRARESLDAYLVRHGIPGISEVDTRALVRHLREIGATNGVIAHGDVSLDALRERARAAPSMKGRNLVDGVTTREPYRFTWGSHWAGDGGAPEAERAGPAGARPRVVAYDFGIKRNILRKLVDAGLDVEVVPANTSAADVLARRPNGVFLSNGPGDPEPVVYAREAVAALVGRVPIFGICLGHQILGLALGGRTEKLRFGHHGANQPAHERATGRVMIASENHGFALMEASLAQDPDIEITHRNLNDRTVEGLRHRRYPIFSVQYHPEASPGPHDTQALFSRFHELCEEHRAQA